MMRNIWLDGMMGLVTGDALGNPVQFMSRNEVKRRGLVTTMEAGGAYNTPVGTWTDDSSMALATLDSIREVGEIVPEDIMINFVSWHRQGDFTPFGRAFDEGITCLNAIMDFDRYHDWRRCGRTGEYANGNGALMRILPVCLFFIEKNADVSEAIRGFIILWQRGCVLARVCLLIFCSRAWMMRFGFMEMMRATARSLLITADCSIWSSLR